MSGGRTPIRRAARGSISRTACGSLRVRVYAGQQRHISLDPDTMALFLDYQQARQRRAATVGATLTPDAFV